MIHYILGPTDTGKTAHALTELKALSKGVFFLLLNDDFDQQLLSELKVISLGESVDAKCVVDLLSAYRENLYDREVFQNKVESAIREAIQLEPEMIFLDEFQLYCTDSLKDLLLSSNQNFTIIHQYPEQLEEEHFTAL